MNPKKRITIDEMMRDPWFKKGYKEVNFYDEEVKVEEFKVTELNAFDIISFSSGLNLPGLFDDSCNSSDSGLQRRMLIC